MSSKNNINIDYLMLDENWDKLFKLLELSPEELLDLIIKCKKEEIVKFIVHLKKFGYINNYELKNSGSLENLEALKECILLKKIVSAEGEQKERESPGL